MSKFILHTKETADDLAKPLLENSLKSFGMIPNLHAVMAEAPTLLEAYQVVDNLFKRTSLSNDEQTVVWQTINIEHQCRYCVPAHTAIANMMGVGDHISDALRNKTPLPDKLEALREFTLKIIRQRGRIEEADLRSFFEAGYTKQNAFEVILGLSQKVMSNYVNHISETPVDLPFKSFSWQPSE